MGKIKLIIKIFLFFILPIFLTCWLYPYKESFIFKGGEYPYKEFKIEDLFGNKKPTFKNLFSDIISKPLFLDWYIVSVVNNSVVSEPNCLISESPTIISLEFLRGDPRVYDSNLKETTTSTGLYRGGSGPGHPSYYLKSGEESYFIAPSWETYSISGGLMMSEGCLSFPISLKLSEDRFGEGIPYMNFDYSISIKPYWKAWLIRLVIMWILCISIASSILSIFSDKTKKEK